MTLIIIRRLYMPDWLARENISALAGYIVMRRTTVNGKASPTDYRRTRRCGRCSCTPITQRFCMPARIEGHIVVTIEGSTGTALEAPQQGTDVWSLAFHPNDANIIYAGYEPCAIYRSEDGGEHWKKMNTEKVVFPHITTYMPPLGKRVIGMAADPRLPRTCTPPSRSVACWPVTTGARAGSRSPTACTSAITPWICTGCRSARRPLAPYTSSPRWPCSGSPSRAALGACADRRDVPGRLILSWAAGGAERSPYYVSGGRSWGGGAPKGPRRPEPCFAAATSVRRGNVSISATRRPAAWRRSPLTVPILPTSTAAPCTDRYTAARMAASPGRKASCRQRRCAVGESIPWRVARGGSARLDEPIHAGGCPRARALHCGEAALWMAMVRAATIFRGRRTAYRSPVARVPRRALPIIRVSYLLPCVLIIVTVETQQLPVAPVGRLLS